MGNTLMEMNRNDELVDYLVSAEFIKSKKIQLVFSAVDRKLYIPHPHRDILKDMSIKVKKFHLSSPSVYATVLENLDLKPGLSFLNIGSGSGYLSTMVGLLLGCSGVNHGIELDSDVVEFAENRVKSFVKASKGKDFTNFCEPLFTVGNFFNLTNPKQKYDRVYCGGVCPDKDESLLFQLVKDDGLLIRASEDSLLKMKRICKKDWSIESLFSVCFFNLVASDSESKTPVMLNDVQPSKLQNICRSYIRSRIRDTIKREHFSLKKKIKAISPEYYSPNSESLFDQYYREYTLKDVIPRDMDVLMTHCLQRFVARDIQRKRINEEDSERRQKHFPSKKHPLTLSDQEVKAVKNTSTVKMNEVPSVLIGESSSSNQKEGGEKKQSLAKSFSEDNMAQQFEPMDSISVENSEKESKGNKWSSNIHLWKDLPDFKDTNEKSLSLVEVNFSELMNQKIQDLLLTQPLKDFLR